MIYIPYLKETYQFSQFGSSVSTDSSSVVLHDCTNFDSVLDNNEEVRNPPQKKKFINSVLWSLVRGRDIKKC